MQAVVSVESLFEFRRLERRGVERFGHGPDGRTGRAKKERTRG